MIDYLKKHHLLLLIIAYLIVGAFFTGAPTALGGLTDVTKILNPWVFNEDGRDIDYRVEGDSVTDLLFTDASTDRVGIATTTPEEFLDVDGNVIVHGNLIQAPDTSATTTTGASATLVENDLLNTGYHIVTLGGAQDTSFTYTLPASTTLTTFVNAIGERAEVCWFNTATSTSAGADLIFAAGTGIDLVVSTTTTPVPLGVGEEQTACIRFFRQPDGVGTQLGDVSAELRLLHDAD